jgi:hypothetical protein
MSTQGVVTDVMAGLSFLLSDFFAADGLQSYAYPKLITFQTLHNECGNNPPTFKMRLENELTTLIRTHYTDVRVSIALNSVTEESYSYNMSISISINKDGTTTDAKYGIESDGSALRKVFLALNEGA